MKISVIKIQITGFQNIFNRAIDGWSDRGHLGVRINKDLLAYFVSEVNAGKNIQSKYGQSDQ